MESRVNKILFCDLSRGKGKHENLRDFIFIAIENLELKTNMMRD